ncbi:unnamed protein product [Owenia fusiformis]|uniref:ethanolamine kinase n=1 Tax=Owenia fusiformis TaxID=6347 RepID=A0A8S4NMC9_OWEFU|nr:unnamed protein product [Owenia fusiformis]
MYWSWIFWLMRMLLDMSKMMLLRSMRPNWKNVKCKVFTGGLTNKLIGCYNKGAKDDMVLVKIYGNGTESFIDRDKELHYMKLLHNKGCAPPIYARFHNGICYGYIPRKCINEKMVRDKHIGRLIGHEMAKIHSIQEISKCEGQNKMRQEPMLFHQLEKYLCLIPEGFADDQEKNKRYKIGMKYRQEDFRAEFERLKTHLKTLDSPVVLCHNDVLLRNIIYNKDNEKITFIDYEYTDYNYQAFDIGNHFNRFSDPNKIDFSLYPTKTFQLSWLREYLVAWYYLQGLHKIPTNRDIDILYVQVRKFSLASHFFWGVWAIVQTRLSNIDFDFLGYAILLLNEYDRMRDDILAMPLPD